MRERLDKLCYILSTTIFALLTLLYVGVFVISLSKNAVDMCTRIGFNWRVTGNYVGLITGFGAYALFAIMLWVLRMRHNLDWLMKFTHELTHTLVALLFGRKIYEFIVRGRECRVRYDNSKLRFSNLPIALSPYCIPIYTFMIFPFRFAGDAHYMIIFDALIAFTYTFHIHAFIKQTRLTQSDIMNSGRVRAVAFISFTHLAVLSLILATPKGGVLKAIGRVFCEYPWQIITELISWVREMFQYF
jgi:hypothetical protein